MIVLHGSWADDRLVLWAEDSDEPAEPRTIIVHHPNGPTQTEFWRYYLVDEDAPEGGFTARALGASIFTEADPDAEETKSREELEMDATQEDLGNDDGASSAPATS